MTNDYDYNTGTEAVAAEAAKVRSGETPSGRYHTDAIRVRVIRRTLELRFYPDGDLLSKKWVA